MSIAVIVPTYRRSQDLARCLEALQNQTRSPDEVIVVIRIHKLGHLSQPLIQNNYHYALPR